MRALACAFGLILWALAAPAQKLALLVGIDRYPNIREGQVPLQGAAADLESMAAMLDPLGFKVTSLKGPDATKEAIKKALQAIVDAAGDSDQVVFYFSGRGSIAPSKEGPAFEPTLVAYDGQKNGLDYDLRMGLVEDWAKALAAKQAATTVILDCCYQRASRAGEDQWRPFNPVSRCVVRPSTQSGDVRPELYRGPGLCLAACPSGGSAYETLLSFNSQTWGGAFTTQLANAVIARLDRKEPVVVSEVMRQIDAFFRSKVGNDYMPGLAPQPQPKDIVAQAATYDAPLFGSSAVTLAPAQQAKVSQRDRQREQDERNLRMGIDIELALKGVERKKLLDLIAKPLADDLESHSVGCVLSPTGGPQDLIVSFGRQGKQLTARVEGRVLLDQDAFGEPTTYVGADIGALLDGGLRDRLAFQALVTRLFRLCDDVAPTAPDDLKANLDKDSYSVGDRFQLTIEAAQGGSLYVLDRDDAIGLIQLEYPKMKATANRLVPGRSVRSGSIRNAQPGRKLVRMLLVSSENLPPLSTASPGAYRESLRDHLRFLVDGIASKRLQWSVATVNVSVR